MNENEKNIGYQNKIYFDYKKLILTTIDYVKTKLDITKV